MPLSLPYLRIWAACLLTLSAAASCGTSSPGELGRSQQAVLGPLDDGHRAVFRAILRKSGNRTTCSATLITPNLLLTARHCLEQSASAFEGCEGARFEMDDSYAEAIYSNATAPELESRWWYGRQVLVRDQTELCGNDLALVVLDAAVPADNAEPISPRIESAPQRGEELTLVGYGASDINPIAPGFGIRHALTSQDIACIGRAECGPEVAASEFGLLQGACRGDSGGPALGARGQLVGVLSRSLDQCTSPVYAAVSNFGPWLIEGARLAAALGSLPVAEWAGGPAPTQMASQAVTDAGRPMSSKVFDASTRSGLTTETQCGISFGPAGSRLPGLALMLIAGLLAFRRQDAR